MNTGLVPAEYWRATHGRLEFGLPPEDHCIRRWLEDNLPAADGDCLEVGCYPGRFLACVGNLGYRLHGIDLIADVEHGLLEWLDANGYRVGSFIVQDFFSFEPGRHYDVVCSFGFIEHFLDWQDVLLRHAALVAPGGLLVLMAPNFRGALQRWFQRLCNRESFERHNLEAMRPAAWARVLESEGFEIRWCGHSGVIDLWVDEQRRSLAAKVLVHLVIRGVLPALKVVLRGDSELYSPLAGVIARRG